MISFSCFYLIANSKLSCFTSFYAIARFFSKGRTFLFTQNSAAYAFNHLFTPAQAFEAFWTSTSPKLLLGSLICFSNFTTVGSSRSLSLLKVYKVYSRCFKCDFSVAHSSGIFLKVLGSSFLITLDLVRTM